MRRFIEWCRSWIALRKMVKGNRLVRRLETRARQTRKALQKRRRQLESAQNRFISISESTMEDVDLAIAEQHSFEEKIDQMRVERDVLRDVLVPSLTGAHKLILARLDAETAIAVRRQVAATMREE